MKEMVRILRVEMDELKMDDEEKEYWDGVKDGEAEDEGSGDQVEQDRLADYYVGDGVGDDNGNGVDDGGCGGALTAAMISSDVIRGGDGDGGAKNNAEDGVEGDDEIDLLDLDVVNYCVK